MFGYLYCVSGSLTGSTNKSAVSGTAYVGAIAGKVENITISRCSNAGSSVSANGTTTVDGKSCTYLGGYVGYGYNIADCDNAVDITYTGYGRYVGGIAGYMTGNIIQCENSGIITASNSSHVGGVAGFTSGKTLKGLTNTAAVTGLDYTGGIVGQLHITVPTANNISNCQNSGKITGGNYTAGIIGSCRSTYDRSSDVIMTINDVTNSGAITGKDYCAGLFGYLYCVSGSLTGGTNTGAITATGTYGDIVAYNKNITIN